jgi:hypothetical protein
MIELDLKRRRLAWPGASCGGLPSSMAERPSRIWFHVACLQRSREGISREGISREGISCRAVRLSVRHLSGLIYDGVDDFVRGANVTGPTKRYHSSRCECASRPRRRRQIVLESIFSPSFSPSSLAKLSHQVRKHPHCRRSLSPAEFGKCGIDAFIRPDPRGSDPSH